MDFFKQFDKDLNKFVVSYLKNNLFEFRSYQHSRKKYYTDEQVSAIQDFIKYIDKTWNKNK